MIEISNAVLFSYLGIGLILGLIVTTFFMDNNDLIERSMVLILVMLFWIFPIVVLVPIGFFAGIIKGADWLRFEITFYFRKYTQKP